MTEVDQRIEAIRADIAAGHGRVLFFHKPDAVPEDYIELEISPTNDSQVVEWFMPRRKGVIGNLLHMDNRAANGLGGTIAIDDLYKIIRIAEEFAELEGKRPAKP